MSDPENGWRDMAREQSARLLAARQWAVWHPETNAKALIDWVLFKNEDAIPSSFARSELARLAADYR